MNDQKRHKGKNTFTKSYKLGLRFDTTCDPFGRAYITIFGNQTISHDCATMGELEWCIRAIEADLVAIRKKAQKKFHQSRDDVRAAIEKRKELSLPDNGND